MGKKIAPKNEKGKTSPPQTLKKLPGNVNNNEFIEETKEKSHIKQDIIQTKNKSQTIYSKEPKETKGIPKNKRKRKRKKW